MIEQDQSLYDARCDVGYEGQVADPSQRDQPSCNNGQQSDLTLSFLLSFHFRSCLLAVSLPAPAGQFL